MCQQSEKNYACKRCGHKTKIKTNHYGECYSLGRFNACPACPPWAKYPEYGSHTTWVCQDTPPVAEATTVLVT